MTQFENKVITIGAGSMNRKLRKFNRDGWHVVSTTSNGYLGAVTVVLQRALPPISQPQVNHKPEIGAARPRVADNKPERLQSTDGAKTVREAANEVWQSKMEQGKARAQRRKADRAAAKSANKTWPPEPWT